MEKNGIIKMENIVNVKVTGPIGSEIEIRTRPTIKIQKMIDAYAQEKNLDPNVLKMINSEGTHMSRDKTLADYDVEDGDMFSIVMEQHGG